MNGSDENASIGNVSIERRGVVSTGFILWLVLAAAAAALPEVASAPDGVPPAAIRAEQEGAWDEALEIYRGVLATRPRADLWLRVADIEAFLGHPEAAAAAVEQASLITPEDAGVQFLLAQARSVAGQAEAAFAAAERAIELEPDNVDYLVGHAQLASWVRRYDLARDSYRRVLAARPDHGPALLGLARTEAWSGELDEAVGHYRAYAESHPEDAPARLEWARAEAWRGNYPAALRLLEEYREVLGETAAYQDDRARTFLGAGWPNTALEILDPRLASEPESFELNADYTLALAESGRPRQALDRLESLTALGPENPKTEEVHRIVGTPMRAVAVPGWDVYRDSDGVELARFGVDGGVSLSPRTRLGLGVFTGELDADAGSGLEPFRGPTRRDFSGLWLGLTRRLGPRTLLEGRVGRAEVDGGRDLATYRLTARFEPSDAVDLDLEVERDFYFVSPRALDLGIDETSYRLRLRWAPDLRYRVEAGVAYDSLSDGNERRELVLAPRRSVLRREHFNLDLGLRAWWFEFDSDLGNGYYDPQRYESYSVTGFSYWKINDDNGVSLMASIGGFEDDTMDGFELGGSANLELQLGVYRDWMLRLRGGFTENARVQSGAFNAWGGGIFLTRRFSGPGASLRPDAPDPSRGPAAVTADAAEEPAYDYASHLSQAHAWAPPPVRADLDEPPPAAAWEPAAERDSEPVEASESLEASSAEPVEEVAEEVSVEPQPPAAAPAPGTTIRRIFELQLGLFHHERNARTFAESFRARGRQPYIVEVESSKGETRYTVRLGPYPSMEKAEEMAAEVRRSEDLLPVIRYRSTSDVL